MKLQIKLKEILREREITQTELSAMSNVTQSKISNLCNNNLKELNIGILERLANALEIEDVSLLMQFEKEE